METKEEIFCKHLGEYVPCELKNVVLTYVETRTILAAVQEYADQEKQALKEKITAIRNRTFWDGEMNVSENGDFVRACNEILKLFNAETLK